MAAVGSQAVAGAASEEPAGGAPRHEWATEPASRACLRLAALLRPEHSLVAVGEHGGQQPQSHGALAQPLEREAFSYERATGAA